MKVTIIKYLYWFFRQVIFLKCENGFSEKFLNLLKHNKIKCEQIRMENDVLYMICDIKNLETIKEVAIQSGMDIKIQKKIGYSFLFNRYEKHIALPIGFLVLAIFFGIMSSRIWNIEVIGNEKIFASQILEICENEGMKIGEKKNSVDKQKIISVLMKNLDIQWVSINIKGMTAQIEVRETEKNIFSDEGKPCNIVAKFSGTIITNQVFSGTPQVTKGAKVTKGDLLISSIVEYDTGELKFVEAFGNIVGVHNVKIVQKNTLKEKTIFTKEKTDISLYLFGKELSFEKMNNFDTNYEKEKRNFLMNEKNMPFGYIVNYKDKTNSVKAKQSKLSLLFSYMEKTEQRFQKSEVLSEKTTYSNDMYEGKIKCAENICKTKKIKVN